MSLINLNSIRPEQISQENISHSEEISYFIEDCLNKYQLTSNLQRKGPARVLDFLLLLANNGFPTKIARETIARNARLSIKNPRQVSRIINDMKKWGHLTIYRTREQANTYILHELFFNEQVRLALCHLIPQLHDGRLNKRKQEAEIIHINKLVKTPKKVSHLKSYREKMSRSLIGIYNINNLSTERGEDIVSSPYVPFNFDDIDIDISVSGRKENNQKQEVLMQALSTTQDLYEIKIIPYVDQLKSVRPTIWGQIKLSAYPQEVVLHADTVTLNCKKPLATAFDRWKYLMSVCSTYCRENQIETSWPMALEIAREMKMPDEGPFFDDSFIPVKDTISISKTKNYKKTSAANQSSGRGTGGFSPYWENMELVRQNNPRLYDELMAERELKKNSNIPKKTAHEIEWERIRVEEPDRFTRLEKSAQSFREILGLNEDGTFKPGHEPQSAVKTLLKVFS